MVGNRNRRRGYHHRRRWYGVTTDATRAAGAVGGSGRAAAPGDTMADLVRERCHAQMVAVSQCDGEQQCAQAQIGLMACIAQHVCPGEAAAFAALKGGAAGDVAAARYGEMEECVGRWARSKQAEGAGSE